MQLMTEDLLKKLQAQDPCHPSGPGRELEDHEYQVLAKYFLRDSVWTWYAISASEDPDTNDIQFFGLVIGLETEFGYFWLSELQRVRGQSGLPVERDNFWKPISLLKLKQEHGIG